MADEGGEGGSKKLLHILYLEAASVLLPFEQFLFNMLIYATFTHDMRFHLYFKTTQLLFYIVTDLRMPL